MDKKLITDVKEIVERVLIIDFFNKIIENDEKLKLDDYMDNFE